MYLKLNLIVICAVLLNFSECKKCDDIFTCVFDWVDSALTFNSNPKAGTIETATNGTEDENLLKNLTQFLINNFTDIFSKELFVKDVEIDTKIYVQTLKVNDSLIRNSVKSDNETHKNNGDTKVNQKFSKDFQNFTNDIIRTNNSDRITYFTYWKNVDPPKNNRTTSEANETKVDLLPFKLDITEIHNSNQTNNMKHQNFAHVIKKDIEDEKTTTAVYLNKDKISEKNKNNDDIIENKSTQGNEIDGPYDFFGNSEIDIGDLVHVNLTDYLDVDYIELYKDTTNEDVKYTPAAYIPTTTEAVVMLNNQKPDNGIDSVYPWIATVFVMNSDNQQFEYICDGSLVSERVVLTAARCVLRANGTVDVTQILVILGKRTLQGVGLNEKVSRIESIKIHENFTSSKGKVDNDLAVIVLDERVVFNVDIQPAPLGIDDKSEPLEFATTGWHLSGSLVPLYLVPQTAEICLEKTGSQNTVCSILGDDESTCSSFGGLLVDRHGENKWRLKGIATGDPMTRGVCFDKDLTFTVIGNYLNWISRNVLQAASN